MFDAIVPVTNFSLGYFQQINDGIPDQHFHTRPHGMGNSPLWIVGHLAQCVEFGEMLLGETPAHPERMDVFGPGSSPDVAEPDPYNRNELTAIIMDGYPRLLAKIRAADDETLNQPHGIALLEGTPLVTKRDLLVHLTTTHITFHLAQLSACRRALGSGPLF